MAPKFPDEVNVFLVPHSRMKNLVDDYQDQLSVVDFGSRGSLKSILPVLEKIFKEFKHHEQIENQYILERLKQRLNMVNVTSQYVCNCHGNSRLTEILELLQDGYACTNKSLSERLMFGSHLLKVVSDFTEDFIPHMEKEEQIFQPLLMEYFAYEEVRALKEQVIQQHEIWKEKLLAQKETAVNMLAILDTVASDVPEFCLPSTEMSLDKTIKSLIELSYENLNPEEESSTSSFKDLPPEMMLHIFSYLNPFDRIRCAQVCKEWNMLAYSPQLWKEVYPTNWAKGYNDFTYRDPYLLVESDWTNPNCNGDDDEEKIQSPQAEHEMRFYEKFIFHGLMRFGEGVQKLVVAGGIHLSSAMLHSMLILCPNLKHLDASYTYINDLAFKGLATKKACSFLQHLDLTGCSMITDVGLERLGACFTSFNNPRGNDFCSDTRRPCKSSKECSNSYISQLDKHNKRQTKENKLFSSGLSYLSLSGCSSVTDFGLRSLLDITLQTGNLFFLDLSGCTMVSGALLSAIAERSSKLLPQDLYYCNRIVEGPYPDEANGCQNLECPVRSCCCFDT